jgi:AraC family transcriptional regulator of adaptative response/methylated-DNA-[protein]-cysteine methyltransferase
VRSARELLERSLQGIGLRELARRVGVSRSHLQRSFTKELGISPHQYSRAVRMRRARSSLAEGTPVTDAFYQAGFSSSRAFYEVAPGFLGMTPSEFQRGGDGVQIRYTASRSELGQLLVATTSRGVCSVKIGASVSDLERQLAEEFPFASLTRDEPGLAELRETVAGLAAGRAGHSELPLDVRGTVFQWQVWRGIQAIPRGSTKTYGQLAAEIARPGAARAVARACATNRVALVIPCHRVVPVAGGEGGYRWGPERKQQLLEAEAAGS